MEQDRAVRAARQGIHRERTLAAQGTARTYAGLAHPTTLSYLQSLGVTSIELLPIQAKQDELFLQERGRHNYWGYSPLSYFSPEPSYATAEAQRKGRGRSATRSSAWCARCMRPGSRSSWTWCTTTPAKAA